MIVQCVAEGLALDILANGSFTVKRVENAKIAPTSLAESFYRGGTSSEAKRDSC